MLQENKVCIRSAEFYLYGQEELSFLDIMARARERDEIVTGSVRRRPGSTTLPPLAPRRRQQHHGWTCCPSLLAAVRSNTTTLPPCGPRRRPQARTVQPPLGAGLEFVNCIAPPCRSEGLLPVEI